MRPYVAADAPAVEALLAAAYPDDLVLREISAVHAEERGTLVAEQDGRIVGVATARHSDRHPTRLFLAGAVHPAARRQGIATALLGALRTSRPLLARVRSLDDAGGRFLRAHGFDLLMRNVTVVVEPGGMHVAVELAQPASLEQLAHAHEKTYARQHAGWMPVTERPVEESLRLFCGDSLVAAVIAERGVASVHDWGEELALIGGAEDDETARSIVAWALSFGRPVSIEADEADQPFWLLAHDLPAVRREQLFLLARDVTSAPVAT